MSTLKVGDKVEIIGVNTVDDFCGYIGRHAVLTEVQADRLTLNFIGGRAEAGNFIFYTDQVRLLPSFKAGDSVRVVSGETEGQTGEIECVWHTEGRADVYEMGGWFYEADELEVLPSRQPKAGEVWELHGYVCHVLHGDRVSGLDNGMLYYPETSHAVLRAEGEFLATDPAAYFKARQ